MVVIVQMNGALFSLRKGASRFKASPRVNLTLLHCQAPQKWSNHLSVWSYRLSIGCSVAFSPPLRIRSEPSAPWAVPFCRPRRSLKGHYNGMLLNRYLCSTLTFPILLFWHFLFFSLFCTSQNPRWRFKRKESNPMLRSMWGYWRKPWCCSPPSPYPTAFHMNRIYIFMLFNKVKVYFYSCAEHLHTPNAWQVCSKMKPPDLLFPLIKCRRQQNLSRIFLVVLQL